MKRNVLMALTILALFAMSPFFVQSVNASPLTSFEENPIPYWEDDSSAIDLTWQPTEQTILIANKTVQENDIIDSVVYAESFTAIDEWAEHPIYTGPEDWFTTGDILCMNMTAETLNDYEGIQQNDLNVEFTDDTDFTFRYRTNITFTDYIRVQFQGGSNTRTFSLGTSITWQTVNALISSGSLNGDDFSTITDISIVMRLDSGQGDASLEVDYLYFGVPDLDITVPVTPQSIQTVEFMGNFSALNSTVRFEMYDDTTASGMWCDVNSTQVTFPNDAYAQFTDVARINISLDEERILFKIYVFAQNTTLINCYSDYVGLANKDYMRMSDSVFNGSYELWYLQGDVGYLEEVEDVTNIFYLLFLSTELWGWFGPLGLVVVTYMILLDKKLKPLGVIFLIIDVLVMSQYFALVDTTPWYWWNIIILILGMLLCVGKLAR